MSDGRAHANATNHKCQKLAIRGSIFFGVLHILMFSDLANLDMDNAWIEPVFRKFPARLCGFNETINKMPFIELWYCLWDTPGPQREMIRACLKLMYNMCTV